MLLDDRAPARLFDAARPQTTSAEKRRLRIGSDWSWPVG